ncbi:SRPBCC family protein [Rhodanobacter sp. 7MK24]|uniref:SRPBCC family protein n=1 Tax=Rhodanobacter sp. 7MK24 TaxID=2775922 RepID=UPI0017805310|nr:SRPBCC family protein [Rhodanobacter sp. 7MK24]MBD8879574.1 SRPBCC family protein [Rhodanobacter sp. 7MK24]
MSGTVRLLRVFTAPPERVYRAFLDPAALAKWLPPDGFTCTVHELDARVGGRYRMSFTNFGSGNGHNFGGTYLELVPHQRIVHDDRFDDPGLPGTMVTTIVLREVGCGTEMQIEQAGIPDMIPTEQCHLGWQESLTLLERLVEPTIPG